MSFAVDMLKMLTSAYNRTDIIPMERGEAPQTNIGKLFYLAGWGFDIIKNQAEKVRLWDNIDKMEGVVLNRFGKDFGVERGEAGDPIMRIMIKVKIIAMLASGNLDTLISSAAALFGIRPEDVRHQEVYPAKVYLYIDEDKLDREHRDVAGIIAGLMSRIKSAGVGIRIFYKTYNSQGRKVYLASLVTETVKININPDISDQYVSSVVEIGSSIATLVHIQRVYYPQIVAEGK